VNDSGKGRSCESLALSNDLIHLPHDLFKRLETFLPRVLDAKNVSNFKDIFSSCEETIPPGTISEKIIPPGTISESDLLLPMALLSQWRPFWLLCCVSMWLLHNGHSLLGLGAKSPGIVWASTRVKIIPFSLMIAHLG
jgi:hypothetical protein